jgi:hypothetical protein
MARMDVFKADGFSMESLLAAVENADYKPQFLGSLNLFRSNPVRTRVVSVESRDNELALIQTSKIGAPLAQLNDTKAAVRNFNTVRIAKQSKLLADEIQGIRAFGTESELKQVQTEVARRMNRLVSDVELTWEHMRLGAVQGIVLDADGSTLVDYFTEFGVSQPAAVNFDFSASDGIRDTIESQIVRPMLRAAKGAATVGTRIVGLAGDDFWDELVNHPEVRSTFINWEAAANLREGTAFGMFRYGGIDWVNYRGTDDGTSVAISANTAKFFLDAPDVFEVAWAPAEFLPVVNQPGVPIRPMIVPDPSGREAFVDIEVYSYPLYLCKRPLTLYRATMTT